MNTIRVPAPPTIDRDELAAELQAAGFSPTAVRWDGGSIEFDFDTNVDDIALGRLVSQHVPSMTADIDLLVEKARAVWAGTDTFTVAQVQKILAGLVLLENRRR